MQLVYNSSIIDIYYMDSDLKLELTHQIKATTKTLLFYKYLSEDIDDDRYCINPSCMVIYKCKVGELSNIMIKVRYLEKSIQETRKILNILTDCICPDIAQYIVYNMTTGMGPCINIYDSGLDRFLSKSSRNTVKRRLSF